MKKLLLMCFTLCIAACTSSSLRPTDPNRTVARSTQSVQQGVILDVKSVTLKADTGTAQALGAGLGGYIAHSATRKHGEVAGVVGTVAGAAIGSVVAQGVAESSLDQQGVELIIQIQNRIISVVQQQDTSANFTVGSLVWIVGYGENVRVLPHNN